MRRKSLICFLNSTLFSVIVLRILNKWLVTHQRLSSTTSVGHNSHTGHASHGVDTTTGLAVGNMVGKAEGTDVGDSVGDVVGRAEGTAVGE